MVPIAIAIPLDKRKPLARKVFSDRSPLVESSANSHYADYIERKIAQQSSIRK